MIKDEITAPSVFILGTQRSGTTLLSRILSSHSVYYAQNELPVDDIFKHADSRQAVLENLDKVFSKSHNGLKINDFLSRQNVQHWAFKDPQLTEYIPSLEYFADTSKFLLITRDARGVVSSYIEQKWGLGTNAYTGALRWQREIKSQFEFMNKHKDKFLHIRFEDLLNNMEDSVRKICKHLNLEFEESMLQYYKTEGFIASSQVNKQNMNTLKKPDAKISKKWKNKLTARQIGIIELVAKEELISLGHELESSSVTISQFEKKYYELHQHIFGWIQLQYKWRKARWQSIRERKMNASIT